MGSVSSSSSSSPSSIALLLLLFLLIITCNLVHGLYPEEAGVLDVTWKTTGHGPVRAAAVIDQVLVTLGGDDDGGTVVNAVVDNNNDDDDDDDSPTRTYIAGRHWKNGTLLWRREVSTPRRPRSTTTTTTSVYIAPSSSGMILILEQGHSSFNSRLWAMAPTTGAVVWDQQIPIVTPDPKTIKKPKNGGGGGVVDVPVLQLVGDDRIVVSGETVLDIASGNIIFTLDTINSDSVVPLDEMARGSIDRIVCHSREFAISPTGTISMGVGTEAAVADDTTTTTLDANELWLLKCDESGIIVLSSSVRGTTAVWDPTNANAPTRILWSTQEGLAGATAAVLVNADPALPREDSSKLLNLQQRWTAQYQSFTSPMATTEWKNHLFGLHKIALVLNSKIHRLFGLDSISGKIVYQMDLDLQADDHKIIEHADEHHQVLVLSIIKTKKEIHCTCLDASTGNWNEKTTTILPLSSSTTIIQQIVPMLIHTLTASATTSTMTGSATMVSPKCAVGALVVLEDGSVLVTDQAIRIPENMYAHAVTEQSIRTYRILPPSTSTSSSAAHWIGTTNFPGETIVTKAYPNRHEVTESPCNVLGDNSLLLKYINPHILVVVTATTTIDDNGKTPITISLRQQKNKKNPSIKRKPAGVEDVTSATTDSVTASTTTQTSHSNPFYNLFVNVVDTVSGKLLYRIGHAQADPQSAKVLISEHWIIYTFANIKTLKAELGVLSLYEGMIEKNGLSVFTKPPSSSLIHSSLVAPPPVVLAKTYVIPYLPTALGMTVTKAGISARRLLLATLDGKIQSLDRNILEPRRPVGPLNENEKKEGLVQYHEMVPFMPYYTISYNLTIEHVHTIQSVATHLESQTIVLAYGGPDLFLTRISPSKGFDVLPESFSRPLILLILAILAVAYYILQQLVNKKVVQQGWV